MRHGPLCELPRGFCEAQGCGRQREAHGPALPCSRLLHPGPGLLEEGVSSHSARTRGQLALPSRVMQRSQPLGEPVGRLGGHRQCQEPAPRALLCPLLTG